MSNEISFVFWFSNFMSFIHTCMQAYIHILIILKSLMWRNICIVCMQACMYKCQNSKCAHMGVEAWGQLQESFPVSCYFICWSSLSQLSLEIAGIRSGCHLLSTGIPSRLSCLPGFLHVFWKSELLSSDSHIKCLVFRATPSPLKDKLFIFLILWSTVPLQTLLIPNCIQIVYV